MSKPDWKIIESGDGVDFLETHGGCFKLPLFKYEGMRIRRLVVETDRTSDVCDKLMRLRQDEEHVRKQLDLWIEGVVAEKGEAKAILDFIPSQAVYHVRLQVTFDGMGFNRSGTHPDVRMAGKQAIEAIIEAIRSYENRLAEIVTGKPKAPLHLLN